MIVANRNHMNIDEMFKEIEPCVNDLVREEIQNFKVKEATLKLFKQPFVPNDKIVGKWKRNIT